MWNNCLKNLERPLVDRIIQWIISLKISDIPAPIDLLYFNAYLYTTSQSNQLINKGFNPKMFVYGIDYDEGYDEVGLCKVENKILKEAKNAKNKILI